MASSQPHTDVPGDAALSNLAHVPVARPIAGAPSGSVHVDDPLMLEGLSRRSAGLDMVAFIVLFLAYQAFVAIVVGRFLLDKGVADTRDLDLGLIIVMGTLTVACIVLVTRFHGLRLSSLGLNFRAWRPNVALGLATAAAGWAALQIIALIIYLIWPAGHQELRVNAEYIQEHLPRLRLPVLAAMTVFVSFWEEVTFRGFLLPRMRRLANSWAVAVVFNSAIFAVLHVGMQVPVIVIPIFGLGVLFSVVTIYRRSLVPAIVAHFVFDLANFLWMAAQNPGWR